MFKEQEKQVISEREIREIEAFDFEPPCADCIMPKIESLVDYFDPKLRAPGEEIGVDKKNTLNIGEYIAKKVKFGKNYRLVLMNFLYYDPCEIEYKSLKSPGIGITYDPQTKEIYSVALATLRNEGLHHSFFMAKKD